jgi:hypothetical protein
MNINQTDTGTALGSAQGLSMIADDTGAGTGAITNLDGGTFYVRINGGASAVTSAYALNATVTIASGTGTIGTGYGVYVNPILMSGITKAYDFYGAGASDLNYFAGNVGIGSLAPGQKLDVIGTVRATAFIGNGSGLTGLSSSSQLWVTGNVGINTTNNVGIGSTNPGQLLDVNGTVRISKLGSTLAIASGTNGCMGQGTLSSGTVTISTTCTPSTSLGIFLTDAQSSLTNVGSVTIATVTPGTSFVIQSTNGLDGSNVNWEIHKTS